ncbi:MAG: hypothetical protein HY720_14485 [Planctomycetes bacterium]|nr:hypothetical protein [Planctomycetota bacterium]
MTMRPIHLAALAFLPLLPGAPADEVGPGGPSPRGSYAVLASRETLADPAWKGVVDALENKYAARVFPFDASEIYSAQDEVAAFAPRYICFVARPSEATRGFVKEAAGFVRTLDDDPYEDAIWGILTGFDAGDALRIATAEPIEVTRAISHVGSGWLEWVEEGVSWNEGTQNAKYVKAKGGAVEEVRGPDDTTLEMAAELNGGEYQMVSTSGHATEHDWQLGFSYPDGQFVSREGRLFGVSRDGKAVEIRSASPKVYFSPGNCLIAHASDMDSMVLAWIHSGGAHQFFGHVVPQFRTCWAWEVAHWFLALQGRFTFAESVHLLHQDVIARLEATADEETRFFLTSDRDSTVLYGDPAWAARVKPCAEPPYEQTLSIEDLGGGKVQIDLVVTAKCEWGAAEPVAAFLPFRIAGALVERSEAARVAVSDDLVLARFAPLHAGDTRKVSIQGTRTDGLRRAARRGTPVEKARAAPLPDLAPASTAASVLVDVKVGPASGRGAPGANEASDGEARWSVDAAAGKVLRVDPRSGDILSEIHFPGHRITCCAWDGEYLWVAEEGLLHVVARGREVLFTIPLPEMGEAAHLAVRGDELTAWKAGTDEIVSARIDRAAKVTLGPARTAEIDFTAEVRDAGAAGLDLVDLLVAAPWDTNRQRVTGEIALSGPARVVEDRWGQRTFLFHGVGVPPGVPFRRTLAWNAELHEARTWIWPDRVGLLDGIPKEILDRYLADSPLLAIHSPEVEAAVREATGEERHPFWIARAAHRFVIDHLRFEKGHGWADARTLLARGAGTCSDYTYLFISLCRSAGLPARFAAGTRCREGNPNVDQEFHRWAEVYLPGYGWVPVDPSSGDSGDPVARAAAFGHVPDTDFVMTAGGGDSELFGWNYNASARVDAEAVMGPAIGMAMWADWTLPGAAAPERPEDGLANGDFDHGSLAGWRVAGPHLTQLSSQTRSGLGACLHIHIQPGASCEGDVAGHPERWERAWRKLRLPEGAAFLRFWAKVAGAAWHEPVRLFLDDGGGPREIFAAGGGDGSGKTMEWTEELADVSSVAGKTVLLGFFSANGNGYDDHETDILVDDVSLLDKDRSPISAPATLPEPLAGDARARAEDAILRLAGPDRKGATEELLRIGAPALSIVEASSMGEDPAIRIRAREVLAALQDLDYELTQKEREENGARDRGR